MARCLRSHVQQPFRGVAKQQFRDRAPLYEYHVDFDSWSSRPVTLAPVRSENGTFNDPAALFTLRGGVPCVYYSLGGKVLGECTTRLAENIRLIAFMTTTVVCFTLFFWESEGITALDWKRKYTRSDDSGLNSDG